MMDTATPEITHKPFARFQSPLLTIQCLFVTVWYIDFAYMKC